MSVEATSIFAKQIFFLYQTLLAWESSLQLQNRYHQASCIECHLNIAPWQRWHIQEERHACVTLSTNALGTVSRGRAAPREELRFDVSLLVGPSTNLPVCEATHTSSFSLISCDFRLGKWESRREITSSSTSSPSLRHLVAASSLRSAFSERAGPSREGPSETRRVSRSWFDGAKDVPVKYNNAGGRRHRRLSNRERNRTVREGRLKRDHVKRFVSYGKPREQLVVGWSNQGPDDAGAATRGNQFPENEGAQADAQGWFVYT